MTSIPPANSKTPIVATNTAADQGGQDIGSQDARQGVKTGHMRWVLGISLALAVVVMSGLWLWHPRNAATASEAGDQKAAASSDRTVESKPGVTPNPTLH